jgi:hypothetical protein
MSSEVFMPAKHKNLICLKELNGMGDEIIHCMTSFPDDLSRSIFIKSVPAVRLPASRGHDPHSKVHGYEATDGQLATEGRHA